MKEKITVPKGKTLEDVINLDPSPFDEDEPCDEENEIEVDYE